MSRTVLFLDNRNIRSIEEALKICRQSFVAVGTFSLFINILMLTPMFYMINVFDKAVGAGSVPTLVALAVVALFLYVTLALLEAVRSRVLTHIARKLDVLLAPSLYRICFDSASGAITTEGVADAQPLGDLNALRQFVGSPNCAVFFDLPWIPLFLVLMFLFHPALLVVALLCVGVMAGIAIANQRATTKGLVEANKRSSAISSETRRNLRNAEVAAAMGMVSRMEERWRAGQDEMLEVQTSTSAVSGSFAAVIKTLMVVVQSIAITTGAVLAISQEISPGVMIGAALLVGKTIQPIQQAVASWQAFVNAREQYVRLNHILKSFPKSSQKMALPNITGHVSARHATVVPPGAKTPTLVDINLDLPAGTVTMILGPSAAGKSTLVRAILGLWPTFRGECRIDGAEASSFDRNQLGPQLGYLPQDLELFDGTVAENIARFGAVDAEQVVLAAQVAGVHEMILSFPNGYDTVISEAKGFLSPGQRQRLALARAFYGNPRLLVLDEPNSNLDELGEQALASAIQAAKQSGTSVIIVSHRQGALPLVDHLVVMSAGRIRMQGPRDHVIADLRAAQSASSVATGDQSQMPPAQIAGNNKV